MNKTNNIVVVGYLNSCTDCALMIANNDTSTVIDEATFRVRHYERIAELTADLVPGTWALVVSPDEPDPFSKTPCDTCGTNLAGERHDVALIGETND